MNMHFIDRRVLLIAGICTLMKGSLSQLASPVIVSEKDTARFRWQIPAGESFVVIYVKNPSNDPVLSANAANQSTVSGDYTTRVTYKGALSVRTMAFDLSDVQTTDSGTYKCGLNSLNIIADCGQKLIVLGQPTKPVLKVPSTPVVGRQLTLTCSSTSTTVPSDHGLTLTYTWQRDNTDITVTSPGSPYIFTVNSRDSHSYRCRARESQGLESQWSDVYNMVPEYAPYDITLQPPSLFYKKTEGQESVPNITCTARCRPDCSYKWYKDGTVYRNGATLNLGQADRTQSGSYQCRATNPHSTTPGANVSVDIAYLDIPTLTLDKSEVMENSTVDLDCCVNSNPIIEMKIKNVDNDTVVVQRNTNTLSYTIQRVQCLHNGTYVCSADQKTTGLINTNNRELNVLCSPRQDNRQPYIETIGSGLNQVASFVASVVSNPTPTFKWFTYVNNQLIPIPNSTVHVIITSDQQSILQITVSHNRDYGRYAAFVENNQGKLQILFTLSPISPPLSPDKMTVSNKTSTSISLRWKSNYNGGSEQTFSVEFQTFQSDWRLWEEGIVDPGRGMWRNTTLTDLRPDTQYYVQVYSRNLYGKSEKVVREAKTQSVQKQETSERLEEGNRFGIGIGIGIAVSLPIIIGLIIALVVSLRRRSPKTEGNTISTDNELQVRNQQNNDIPSTYTHLKTDNQSGNEYEKIDMPSDTTGSTTVYQQASVS